MFELVKFQLRNLSHIGTPLPSSWVNIRQKLEQHERNYIKLDEYYAICDDCDLDDHSKQLTVIDYLHALGVCLHFKEDDILRRFVILKPEWGTDAVYKVLDNSEVRKNFGRFTREDLSRIWSDPTYDDMHFELLQLMMRFKLCYEIPGEPNHYIAPQLLSENQPDYKWDKENNLKLRYRYDFMPKGLVTRLIVALHRHIGNDLVWKTGVILQQDNTYAEVIEYYHNREIHVRVRGVDRKGLLSIIMYELEIIHRTYKKLVRDALIPCNCPENCLNNPNPYFFKYNTLISAIQKNQGEIQCQISFEMVNARQLIDNVIPHPREQQQVGKQSINELHVHGDNTKILLGEDISMSAEQNKNVINNEGGTFGNFNTGNQQGANINISIGALETAPENSQLAELREKIKELQAELEKVAEDDPDDVEMIEDYANQAIAEAIKDKPNQKRLKITGESLKAAAENLRTVAPIARDIALILLGLG